MREDDRYPVSRQGTAAWKGLKTCKSYTDWLLVGEALQVGREWAMNQASTNKPEGKAYNMYSVSGCSATSWTTRIAATGRNFSK